MNPNTQIGEELLHRMFQDHKVEDTGQLIEILSYLVSRTAVLVAEQAGQNKAEEYLHYIAGFSSSRFKRVRNGEADGE